MHSDRIYETNWRMVCWNMKRSSRHIQFTLGGLDSVSYLTPLGMRASKGRILGAMAITEPGQVFRPEADRSANRPESSPLSTIPRQQIQKFAACFWPMRAKVRVRRLAIGDPIIGDAIVRHVPFHLIRADAVRLHRVQSENLGPQLGSDLGVAVFLTKLL